MDRHVGVDLDVRPVGMAGHLLDQADVGAVFQHQGGHGVKERVAVAVLVDAGTGDAFLHGPADSARIEALAGLVDEQRACGRLTRDAVAFAFSRP